MTTRAATHANSWYSGVRDTLNSQLDSWLEAVGDNIDQVPLPVPTARIIIAPHAGYSYSGPAAAWAYKSLDLSKAKRVFILGPSHHVYMDGCALSACTTYQTPLGNLAIDTETIASLQTTGPFQSMNLRVDEEEHSIEMHLPYVYKMIERAGKLGGIKVVPIMVGSISTMKEKLYGEALASYLQNPENCFVISSDFCHWGSRFSYTHYYPELPSTTQQFPQSISLSRSNPPPRGSVKIYESIEALDRQGMAAIESGSHDNFSNYLKKTHNTICGRHPIGVVMAGLEVIWDVVQGAGKFKFVRYEQSSRVKDPSDSSVSYASAYAICAPDLDTFHGVY
ncbi:UPF0103-domain-containing protein [Ascodesmis nigricans]|uniref:UPF0103-domain-containing protein n=1 Tax=Ascodesmis nigricans TaxID=341454 RepID=A0A4S2N4B3_9PEZI|nr:UPF0103-domain-containing protein [Ascodesmis nigricans]